MAQTKRMNKKNQIASKQRRGGKKEKPPVTDLAHSASKHFQKQETHAKERIIILLLLL